ncbi:translation initiation factor 3 subunit A [Acrasis kona]|uniref:Translation initiation factor 3 subunit A n=1 Tax=Acrasis kona TaxID=1008807 RepID=A0AAW2YRM3_9EUKA
MSAFYSQRAENVLKRSEDLIQSNQTQIAFQEMQGIVTNKRIKQWDERLEGVMKKFIELCVELRRGQDAKLAIIQYRTLCGTTNTNSLDDVLDLFLDLSEKRAQKAQNEAKNVSLDLENDLEDEVSESFLMSEISGEEIKDRSDREIVTPWLKFLWETYRNVLDVLKSYAALESRYHDACQRAFKFCKRYKRKREFKNLSDILRNHLTNVQRYATTATTSPFHKITLSSPETLQYYLDTRFKQLSTASHLELWQEAYRSIEDIHRLLALSKDQVKPQQIIFYYEHLTKIYWNSENYILHSYALYKLFNLLLAQQQAGVNVKKNEDFEHLDLKVVASSLLLSSLSIPTQRTTHNEDIVDVHFGDVEKQQRLANLLDLATLPDKKQLLRQVVNKQVTSQAHAELKDLYQILEVDLDPLHLHERVANILTFTENHPKLKIYNHALKQATLSKLLTQLSSIYQSIRLSKVVKLASFISLPEIERAIVQAVQQRRVLMTIDHQNDCITFGNNKNASLLDVDTVRGQLTLLSKRLYVANLLINPVNTSAVAPAGPVLLKSAPSAQDVAAQHAMLASRRELIEKKKQWEAENKKKELELLRKQEEEEKRKKEEEEKRLTEKEAKDRELAAQRRAEEEAKAAHHKKILDSVRQDTSLSSHGVIGGVTQDSMKVVKEEEVKKALDDRVKELNKAKLEKEKKLLQKLTNLDVLERAKRTEEIPLVKKYYETQKTTDKERHESQHKLQQDQLKQKHENHIKMRAQLSHMFKDRKAFIENEIAHERREKAQVLKQEQDERRKVAKQAWLHKRELIVARLNQIKKEQEEIENKKAEAARVKREAEEQKKRELEEEKRKRDKEEEERRLRQQRITDQQEKKMREIEEKEQENKRRIVEERLAREREQREEQLRKAESNQPKSRWGDITSTVREPPKREEAAPTSQPRRVEAPSTTTSSPAPRRFDDAPPRGRFDDAPPRRFDDGPRSDAPRGRFDDGPRRFNDGPRGDAPRGRFDDGPRSDAPRGRFDDGPRRDFGSRDAPRDAPRGRFDDGRGGDAPRGRFDDGRGGDAPRGRFDDGPRGGRFEDSGPRRSFNDGPKRDEKPKTEEKKTGSRWSNI